MVSQLEKKDHQFKVKKKTMINNFYKKCPKSLANIRKQSNRYPQRMKAIVAAAIQKKKLGNWLN